MFVAVSREQCLSSTTRGRQRPLNVSSSTFRTDLHGVGPLLQQAADDGADLHGQRVVQLWQGTLEKGEKVQIPVSELVEALWCRRTESRASVHAV